VRTKTPLSVVLLDVDFFKRFNDCYGHQAGDDCLRRVAAAMSGCVHRPADLVARYGGEEFVCLLPDTPLEGALKLAEEIRQAVLALHIDHAESSVEPFVSVSLGASSKCAGGDAAALLRGADEQLYRAKGDGRNRVCGAELTVA
jgi:diguanylate cyclase (GGDEF)-like protein